MSEQQFISGSVLTLEVSSNHFKEGLRAQNIRAWSNLFRWELFL